MLKAYVLIETTVGTSPKLLSGLKAIQEVRSISRVTGPHDIIALIETVDLEALGGFVEERIHTFPGVQRTVTCVVVPH